VRHATQEGLDLIKRFEGFSPTIYICPAGYPTIGYGHVVRDEEKDRFAVGIGKEEGEELLRRDVHWAERGVHGGHNIPVADIERRFPSSLRYLLNDFSICVDSCVCFMNDGESPVLVFEQRGSDRDIMHDDYYQLLLEEANR
jgi:hypothetical protein